jgi:hypothetical protein
MEELVHKNLTKAEQKKEQIKKKTIDPGKLSVMAAFREYIACTVFDISSAESKCEVKLGVLIV